MNTKPVYYAFAMIVICFFVYMWGASGRPDAPFHEDCSRYELLRGWQSRINKGELYSDSGDQYIEVGIGQDSFKLWVPVKPVYGVTIVDSAFYVDTTIAFNKGRLYRVSDSLNQSK